VGETYQSSAGARKEGRSGQGRRGSEACRRRRAKVVGLEHGVGADVIFQPVAGMGEDVEEVAMATVLAVSERGSGSIAARRAEVGGVRAGAGSVIKSAQGRLQPV